MSMIGTGARTVWRRRCGVVAGVWAGGFAVLHFYWALGGDAGLAVSAGPQLAAERPAWFVALGLWGVGALCVAGMGVALELTRSTLGGVRRILVKAAACLVGVVLLVRALSVELLLLAGSTLDGTVGPEHRFWTLVLWNPWFAAGGAAFLLAGLGYRARRQD